MDKISNLLNEGATSEMIYKGNETGLSDTSKLMLDSYKDKFSHSNYQDHRKDGAWK